MGIAVVNPSQAARNTALANVAQAHQTDVERVCATILALCDAQGEITADDVSSNMLLDPASGPVIGTAFAILSKRKRIAKTGRLAQSKRTNQHAATLIVWRRARPIEEPTDGRVEQAARRARAMLKGGNARSALAVLDAALGG